MNILINSYCNLKCPYCFADPTMEQKGAQNMTMENFETAIEWCKKLGQQQMRIIGGEPTLSPMFSSFLDRSAKEGWFDNILIFTNLTFDRKIAEKIAQVDRIKPINILANINEFDLLIPKYKQNILFNINYLYQNLDSFRGIGINIYRPDMDLSQWEQIFKMYPFIRYFRYSIAIPNKTILSNNFNFYEYYHQFQPLLLQLNDMAVKYNLQIGCDCNNIPICCFDDDAITKMLKGSGAQIFSQLDISSDVNSQLFCGYPVIDLRPDLTIAPCFGYNISEQPYITNFENPEDLMSWLNSVGDTRNYIARKECLDCIRYKRTGKSCSCKSCHLIKKDEVE